MTNELRYYEACQKAKERSLTDEYRGCVVHVNAQIGKVAGIPQITHYTLDDWCDGCTVASYVNGERI